MKFLIIGLHLIALQYTPNIAPTVPDAAAYYPLQSGYIVYAHSYLTGSLFDLDAGDPVTLIDSVGKVHRYEVRVNSAYVARSTIIAAGGGDFELSVDGEWTYLSQLFDDLVSPDNIILFTCWSGRGDVVTGRRVVVLRPVVWHGLEVQ